MIIGVGVDICGVARFAAMLARRPKMVERLFNSTEVQLPDGTRRQPASLAARFAAKEAVMKALGVGLGACEFTDIEVVRDDDSGAPAVALHGRARQLADEAGVSRWLLTLSHSDTTAHAIAVAL